MFAARMVGKGFCIVCEQSSVMGRTHELCHTPGVPKEITSVFVYEGMVRKCIKDSKYAARAFASLKKLASESATNFSKTNPNLEGFAVVPIPLSKQRAKSRGYNQAEIIAQIVSKNMQLKLKTNILSRIEHTKAQYTSNRAQRFKNMQTAFEGSSQAKGKKILLVDDICTTGATFVSASKALYQAGAKEVRCFSIAKKL